MYALFNDRMASSKGTLIFPDYEYVRKGLARELGMVVNYYRRSSQAVESSHFLIRVLQSLNVPLSLDVNIYRDRVEDAAEDLSMALQMTSPLSVGKLFSPGVFYGAGSSEVLVSVSEPVPTSEILQNWETLQPIRWLSHPKSDLGFSIPKGHPTNEEFGVSVITVDIPLLACQYRMWRLREQQFNTDAQKTVAQFVAQFDKLRHNPCHQSAKLRQNPKKLRHFCHDHSRHTAPAHSICPHRTHAG